MNIRKSCAAALVFAALSAFGMKARAVDPPAPPALPATTANAPVAAPDSVSKAVRPARLRPYSPTARCGNRRPGATGHFLRRGAR